MNLFKIGLLLGVVQICYFLFKINTVLGHTNQICIEYLDEPQGTRIYAGTYTHYDENFNNSNSIPHGGIIVSSESITIIKRFTNVLSSNQLDISSFRFECGYRCNTSSESDVSMLQSSLDIDFWQMVSISSNILNENTEETFQISVTGDSPVVEPNCVDIELTINTPIVVPNVTNISSTYPASTITNLNETNSNYTITMSFTEDSIDNDTFNYNDTIFSSTSTDHDSTNTATVTTTITTETTTTTQAAETTISTATTFTPDHVTTTNANDIYTTDEFLSISPSSVNYPTIIPTNNVPTAIPSHVPTIIPTMERVSSNDAIMTVNNPSNTVGSVSLVEGGSGSILPAGWNCNNYNYHNNLCLYLTIFNTQCNGIETISITTDIMIQFSNADVFNVISLQNNNNNDDNSSDISYDFISVLYDTDESIQIEQNGESGGIFIAPKCDSDELLHIENSVFNIWSDIPDDAENYENRAPLAGGNISNFELLTSTKIGRDAFAFGTNNDPVTITIINDLITNTATITLSHNNLANNSDNYTCTYNQAFKTFTSGNDWIILIMSDEGFIQFEKFTVHTDCKLSFDNDDTTNNPTINPTNLPTVQPTKQPTEQPNYLVTTSRTFDTSMELNDTFMFNTTVNSDFSTTAAGIETTTITTATETAKTTNTEVESCVCYCDDQCPISKLHINVNKN